MSVRKTYFQGSDVPISLLRSTSSEPAICI